MNSTKWFLSRMLLAGLVTIILLAACSQPQPQQVEPTQTKPPQPTPEVTILPRSRRPNVVLIITDDLDARLGTLDTMPNLQKLLVGQGLSFNDFYVSDSLCCPSRTTFLRGQYVHNHAIYTNNYPSGGFQKFYETGLGASTLAVWLQSAGYRTALLGKYLNGYPMKSDPLYIPPGWSDWYSPIKGKPYSGFNYTMNENGQAVDYGEAPEDYITDVMTRKALEVIASASADSQPFFVYFATFAPHEPPKAAYRHRELFLDARAPQTPSFNEADVSDKPIWIQQDPLLTKDEIIKMNEIYIERLQSMQAVDEMIPQLIKTLQDAGTLDNTYIIFTSDNGYHLGQHRLKNGKATAYIEDIQVPFIVRGPSVPQGAKLDGYVTGNIDFAPTIADLAGVIPPPYSGNTSGQETTRPYSTTVDGRSLMPLLVKDPPPLSDWRKGLLIESYRDVKNDNNQESNASTSFISFTTQSNPALITTASSEYGIFEPPDVLGDLPPDVVIPFQGIITAQYKYVRYDNGYQELYDIQADPYELQNLSANADPVQLTTFSKWLDQLSACAGETCRVYDLGPPQGP